MRWRAFLTKGMLYWKLYFISLIKFLYSCILRQDICTLTVSSAASTILYVLVAFKELKSVELWSVMLGIMIGMTFRGAGRNQRGDKGELSGCCSVSWFCSGSGHVGFTCENSLSCHVLSSVFIILQQKVLKSNKTPFISGTDILSFLSMLITVNAVKHNKEYESLFLTYLIVVLPPKVSRNF